MYTYILEKSDKVIIRKNNISAGYFEKDNILKLDNHQNIINDAIFFDLEHYVYKKPICVGVFGCSYYDKVSNEIKVTQYMIENSHDAEEILFLAEKYFEDMNMYKNKKYIITFSGNNDFTVINYLFEKHNINYKICEKFFHIDIQKIYERDKKVGIGLKALEKEFEITRESELISGSTLAKTFGKIVKDKEYFNRMPQDKKEKILLYNEQDVVSLFHILVNWNNIIIPKVEDEKVEEI